MSEISNLEDSERYNNKNECEKNEIISSNFYKREFSPITQNNLQPPTIRIIPSDYNLNNNFTLYIIETIKEKLLLLKRWLYYIIYNISSCFTYLNFNELNVDQIYKCFIYGQLFSVISAAIWWGFYGTVITFMMESEIASGNARLIFNIILVIMSPFTGIISEKISMKSILIYITSIRMFVWCTFVPLLYLIGRNLNYKSIADIIGINEFYLFVIIDGILVSLINAVDIDCGGLNRLSNQYDFEITPIQKSQAIFTHLTIFDLSFIFLNPIIALLILFISRWYYSDSININNNKIIQDYNLKDSGIEIPLLIIITIFQIFSTISLLFYKFGIPNIEDIQLSEPIEESEIYYSEINQEDIKNIFNNQENNSYLFKIVNIDEIKNKIINVIQGFKFVRHNIQLRNRIIYLAFETAMEDAMTSIIIPLIIINISRNFIINEYFSYNISNKYWASISLLIVSITIGIGKLSSFIITWKYQKSFIPSNNYEINSKSQIDYNLTNKNTISSESSLSNEIYFFKNLQDILKEDNLRKLLLQISIADLSVLILPISFTLIRLNINYFIIQIISIFYIFIFSGIFFGCYSAPKVILGIIYQYMIEDEIKEGKIFAFSGIIITIIDGLIICLMSLILYISKKYLSFEIGLYIISTLYILHAFVEWKFACACRIHYISNNRDFVQQFQVKSSSTI